MSLINAFGAAGGGLSAYAGKALAELPDDNQGPLLSRPSPAAEVVETPASEPAKVAINPKLDQIVAAIYGQESGSGANTSTSVTGARGGMQIQPATFQQYAKPGESIDNPTHNMAVGERIIADLWARSGGDPARIAVGYFSGPGNIAPPDSPTPWVHDRSDPNGKSVSSYVGDVLRRLASDKTRGA